MPAKLSLFLAELKRRKVYHVFVAYVLVGSVLGGVANDFLPQLGAPGWATAFVIVLILIGLPIALVLAWAYEVKPGEPRLAETNREGSASPLQQQVSATGTRPAGGDQRKSIVVLPFANMSADAENEYFSDGITDEIINLLSRIPDLRVTARTSAFAFKGAQHDIGEIGARLSVESILEGSVRRSGSQLRVAVQLVDVSSGATSWSERFDRELSDVFAIQDEIASVIAQRFSSTSPGSETSAKENAPASLEAYDAYLRGRFHWAMGSSTGLQRSITHYHRAIELDPEFAAAHAGLALSYSYQTMMLLVPQADSLGRLRAVIDKALSLDDSQADAHAASGYLKMIADWDWAGAEADFKRAIEVNPSSASAYHQYSILLSNLGFAERAIATSKQAVKLDPLYAGAVQTLGYSYMGAGDFEEAVRLQLQTLEMEPTNFGAHVMLPVMYTALGRHEEAIAAGEHGIGVLGKLPMLLSHLGYAHARAGNVADALRLLDELRELKGVDYVSASTLAVIHLGLGQVEETMDWLEKAFEERCPLLVILPHWYEWDPYRGHPRFQRIYRAMGFDQHAAPRRSAEEAEKPRFDAG